MIFFVTGVPRQNLISAENGATPCRERANTNCELSQACSPDSKFLRGSNPWAGPAIHKDGVRACGFRTTRLGSGSPIVTMMQPAESRMRKNMTRGYGTRSVVRCSLPPVRDPCGLPGSSGRIQRAIASDDVRRMQ